MAVPGSGSGHDPAADDAGTTARSGNPPDQGVDRPASPAPTPAPLPPPVEHAARGAWSHPPFVTGFLLAAGALLAWWFGGLIIQASSVLVLVVVSLFLAFGLSPVVQWLIRRGVRHSVAVFLVALGFVAALALFVLAVAPVVADQISTLSQNAPGYFDQLQHNRQIQRLDNQYDLVQKAKHYVTSGDLAKQAFGGRARGRAGDPGRRGQHLHRDRADALLHGLARRRQAHPLPPGAGQPARDRHRPR